MNEANTIPSDTGIDSLPDDFLELYAMMCRTISKPPRLRILFVIGDQEMNVSDIQKRVNLSLPSLSNHLNDLYRAGILRKHKDGNFVYYSLTRKDLLESIQKMMGTIKLIMSSRDMS